MAFTASSKTDRARSAIGAVLLTGALGYALALGLAVSAGRPIVEQLEIFDIGREPAPPPPAKHKPPSVRPARPEGAAAPPNLRAEPSEIVAPPPILPPPPTIAAAPIAGVGAEASAGSAEIPGPGTGAGGFGDGRGSGSFGNGDGGGGEDTPPRQIRGALRDSDYPRSAADAGAGGTVGVRYTVWTDGRVTACEVTQSSGNTALDEATCRLIRERFRFRPSRDGRGRPVPSTIVENHSWILEREPAEPREADIRRRRG